LILKDSFQSISAINTVYPQIGYENPNEELGEGIILIGVVA
jgi:hypothetical protein